MAKIFSIYDTYIAPGVDDTSDIGSLSLRWKNIYLSRLLTVSSISADLITVGTVSATGTGVFGGSLTVGTGTIIAAKITATTGSFTALLTAGTASISGAIIGGTTLTIGTVTATGLIAGNAGSFATTVVVADSAYSASWDGSLAVPTRNAVYDKIEALNTTSGTYTPTLTNIANLSGSTAFSCQYQRVGNTVVVSGKVNIAPTLTVTATSLDISLPVSSTLASSNLCAGTAASPGIAGQVMAILANTASNVAQMSWKSSDITSQDTYLMFSYRVV